MTYTIPDNKIVYRMAGHIVDVILCDVTNACDVTFVMRMRVGGGGREHVRQSDVDTVLYRLSFSRMVLYKRQHSKDTKIAMLNHKKGRVDNECDVTVQ